ncbi:MAG: T9SS type A sorting domain-containing protein [Ignavibacteriae bacterium]|nr:T9SS type A sorting domain-containing protein [Ignavibacteriota bacterium]
MKSLQAGITLLLLLSVAHAQQRRFEVHNRGMLHQSVYNTGELGRAYDQGAAGVQIGNPSFEWPGNSSMVVDNVSYTGQHNSFGGGVQLAVNRRDTTRMYVYCGGVSQLPADGVYSFPLTLTRTENFPLLADGSLNPAYNANEAEEKIVSSWATPAGITMTRTSRAWSAPNYDDFIIYEYELENTGDTDGNAGTPARRDTLRELLVSFSHGLAPGKTGHERKYNRWNGSDFQQTDTYARFDRRRWLNYAENVDGLPDPRYFEQWAQSGTNGGGLQAPMSVGYVVLYYDTTRLARRGESIISVSGSLDTLVWDANLHLKQPYLNRLETSLWSEAKYITNMNVLSYPRSGNSPYSNRTIFGNDWIGRSSFNVRQSWIFGVGRQIVFGPYTLKPGEKIRFALAEVAGFGSANVEDTRGGHKDEGGSCGQGCNESASANAFNPVINLTDTIRYGMDNKVHGSTYLSRYRLPEYVNSRVVTVRDVADRAIQIYTGATEVIDYDSSQYWPERSADHGVFRVPVTAFAPVISIETDSLQRTKIVWPPAVDSLMQNTLSHYEVARAPSALGPWTRVDSIGRRDPRYFKNGKYVVEDFGPRLGEQYYYSVISLDNEGNRSARTGVLLNETQRLSLNTGSTLEPVYVVPNPYFVRSGFGGANNPDSRVGFYNLPPKCTIRIFSYSGQLVSTFEHTNGKDMEPWYQVTRNAQFIASGLYFYLVTTPDGRRTHGKFVIIH